MPQMTITVTIHQEDDGSFWAEPEELPGCFASGDTLEELNENLAEAISLYLAEGDRIPVVQLWQRGSESPVVETSAPQGKRINVLVG